MIIDKITVNGLFHKHNITLDFNRKLNVLLGANGTGKSTVLRIVDALQKEDFVELVKYEFDSLDITTTVIKTTETSDPIDLSEIEDIEEIKRTIQESNIDDLKDKVTIHIDQEDLIPSVELIKEWYEAYFTSRYEFQHISFPVGIDDQESYLQEVLDDAFMLIEDLYY